MVSLSEDQRKSLTDKRSSLEEARSAVLVSVQKHGFPETYAEFTDLMARQIAAIDSLLTTGETGCELGSLKFDDKVMLNDQHLKNLAYSSTTAGKLTTEAEQEKQLYALSEVLHGIKGHAQVSKGAFGMISRLGGPGPSNPTPPDQQWQR